MKNSTKENKRKVNIKEEKKRKNRSDTIEEIKETKAFLKKIKKEKLDFLKKEKNMNFSEFYDLPLRYNTTIVRLISQSPKRLFVYWDISDKDKKDLEAKYSKKIWEESYPILIIKNKNNGDVFEVKVNDFANSWYIDIDNHSAKYEVELARRFFNNSNDVLHISNSNDFVSQNKNIIFSNEKYILFKNILNNENKYIENSKNLKNNMSKIYNMDLQEFEDMLKNNSNMHLKFLNSSSTFM